MSTQVHPGSLSTSPPASVEPTGPLDPVLATAADRPLTDSLPALPDPTADHEDAALRKRRQDVELKHDRIRAFLEATGRDAVLLGRADSVSWFTSGGDLGHHLVTESSTILLFINRTARAVIADNVQSGRVFEEELAGLGFQLKEYPWFEDPTRVAAELCHNRKVACDLEWGRNGAVAQPDSERLRRLRWRLTPLERQRLRELGRTLTLAVEATCRNFDRGEREADVAGHLAHRLLREGVVPIDLRVASDDRLARFRQPTFKAAPIHRRATITVTGRRHGLCCSVTRTVAFGTVEPEFRAQHGLACMVDATYIFFSRPGEAVSEVFRRGRRIYEKFGASHEWTLDYQGSLLAYSPTEAALTPESSLVLEPDEVVCWSPSVGSARSEDTVVVDSRGFEVVTAAQDWPQLEITVKGYTMPRPGILIR